MKGLLWKACCGRLVAQAQERSSVYFPGRAPRGKLQSLHHDVDDDDALHSEGSRAFELNCLCKHN